MKEFYVVIPEGWEGKHKTLEEAKQTAINCLRDCGKKSYIFKAIMLCKKKEPEIDWVNLEE